MTEPNPSPSHLTAPKRKVSLPDLVLALSVTLLGIAFWLGSAQIPFGINAVVGPRLFPLIVSVGLTVLGTLLTINTLRGDRAEPATEEDTDPNAPVNHAATNIILGGFLLGTLLLQPLGFVVGTAVMYFSVAYAFGERRLGLIAVIALSVALVTYLAFTRGLGLTLPAGLLKGIL